jgi:thiamine pyrophosphate-dependent acetolactate synthase large subunit-like protein
VALTRAEGTAASLALTPNVRSEEPAEPLDPSIGWGSDVAAQMLRRLDIPFIALNPGASYRGLHDSLVNHLGNVRPQMLLCLHEEHAVAIAHGYAKASGKPLAVAVHSNVGLMHATMAIFNAWCDRQPMLILGATGPLDATQRRPWIDWLHTSQDQAGLVRNFIKWDDQPGSVAAIPEAILRGWQTAGTAPQGPVYVCLDAALQEERLDREPELPDPARFAPPSPSAPDPNALSEAAHLLRQAKRPLILFGRCRRTDADWERRVTLAERLGAAMLSDLKAGAMVPSDHPLHAATPFNKLSAPGKAALNEADVILSLGWIDLGGLLNEAFERRPPSATIIHAGQDVHLHNGWGKEHSALPPVDVHLLGDPDQAAAGLLALLPEGEEGVSWFTPPVKKSAEATGAVITLRHVARALSDAVDGQPVTFAALPRGWPCELWPHRGPLDYLGKDGGGGVGAGPGVAIGAALALKDSGRLAVGVLGDGDTLMSINALWTAAHYQIPAIIIVSNNRSYYNDEQHQESVARTRGRNTGNKWVGQAIDGPAPDIAQMARAQGVDGYGPIVELSALGPALKKAVETARAGRPCVVDVHIDPRQGREVPPAARATGAG